MTKPRSSRSLRSLPVAIALTLSASGLAALCLGDPMPLCIHRGGSAGTFCTLSVPITMLSQDVSIRQDPAKGWTWNVTAHYRFRNNSKKALTIPIAFPVGHSDYGCVPEVSGFQARINGVLYKNYDTIECAYDDEPCPWAELTKAKSALGKSCRGDHEVASCNSGDWHCFVADFPAETETVIHIAYSFENMVASRQYDGDTYVTPPVEWRSGEAISCSPRRNKIPFVLRTGASWEGSIGSVKFHYAVRDVPYGLSLEYGDHVASFAKGAREKLGPFTAELVNGKRQTEVIVEGTNIEPDADLSLSYLRNFVDLELALISRCGGQSGPVQGQSAESEALLKLLCKVLPHYYIGYRLKNPEREKQIQQLLKREGIQDPRTCYSLPPTVKLDEAELLARGKRQLNLFDEADSPRADSCLDGYEDED